MPAALPTVQQPMLPLAWSEVGPLPPLPCGRSAVRLLPQVPPWLPLLQAPAALPLPLPLPLPLHIPAALQLPQAAEVVPLPQTPAALLQPPQALAAMPSPRAPSVLPLQQGPALLPSAPAPPLLPHHAAPTGLRSPHRLSRLLVLRCRQRCGPEHTMSRPNLRDVPQQITKATALLEAGGSGALADNVCV